MINYLFIKNLGYQLSESYFFVCDLLFVHMAIWLSFLPLALALTICSSRMLAISKARVVPLSLSVYS